MMNIEKKERFYKRKGFKIFAFVVGLLFIVGGAFAYKTGNLLSRISSSNDSGFRSLLNVLPGIGDDLKKQDDGRLNVLLLGMRGENIPGGGLLADSIILLSIKKDENKVAMISIPRDLYVKIPGADSSTKINGVHAFGEGKGRGQGLKQMETVVSQITGLDVHYAVSMNFYGFKQLIDSVGGVDINLETPFYEMNQFVEGKECGGQFQLPVGKNTLDGEKALCYARARDNTSDFDRAKRQQIILQSLKEKLISLGTLSDFSKVIAVMDTIGDNVRTDMTSTEMKKFFEEYISLKDAQVFRRVFENSSEGLLMVPEDSHGAGYILVPRAGQDNYSEIQNVCKNIFNLPSQSDIDPIKQYTKPAPKEKKEEKKKKTQTTSSTSKSTTTETSIEKSSTDTTTDSKDTTKTN